MKNNQRRMNSSDQPEWGVFMGGVNGLLMLSKGIHLKNRPTKASFDMAGQGYNTAQAHSRDGICISNSLATTTNLNLSYLN